MLNADNIEQSGADDRKGLEKIRTQQGRACQELTCLRRIDGELRDAELRRGWAYRKFVFLPSQIAGLSDPFSICMK